ncbi:MAG: O-antigen ligase family protein [Oligoflexales bacterium]
MMSSLIPGYLLLATLPFGIALQKASTALAVVWLSITIQPIKSMSTSSKIACFLWLWMGFISFYHHDFKQMGSWMFGHLEWWLLPILICQKQVLQIQQWERAHKILTTGAIFLSLVVINQYCFGWRIQGTEFIPSEFRPRGFFSHPLNLAYSTLIGWPLALSLWFRKKDLRNTLFLFAVTTILALTMSRTVQAVALCAGVWTLLTLVTPSSRKKVLIGGLLLTSIILITPNPIGQKFIETWTIGLDRHSHYTFDRIAFWDVHWHMFQEQPLIGHGTLQNNQTRLPWYALRGLPNFSKPYPAHNMYLQFLVEGGLIAGSLFLLWIASIYRDISKIVNFNHKNICFITWTSFVFAAMTQNAFQDSTVRLCLSLLLCFIALTLKYQKNSSQR